jgi:outer membrane cobalamin receptor
MNGRFRLSANFYVLCLFIFYSTQLFGSLNRTITPAENSQILLSSKQIEYRYAIDSVVKKTIQNSKAQISKSDSSTSPQLGDDLLNDESFNDTTKKTETKLPFYSPMRNHGAVSLLGYSANDSINKRDIQLLNYTGLHSILEQRLPAFPLHLGYFGLYNQFAVLGATHRDNSLLFNGRSLNDGSYGTSLLEQYPMEFFEQAEILLGSRAVLFSDNSSGMAINIAEPRYNTKDPYTRIWYSQGGYNFIASDGVYSQNIARNLNATVGFRRQSGDGRFANQALDSWVLRALVRWNISERTSLSFTHIFTNHYNGTNGGINRALSPNFNDEVTAQVMFPSNNERVYRHDATLAFSSYLAEDSSSAVYATAYGSNNQWERERTTNLAVNEFDSTKISSMTNLRFGATLRYEQRLWSGMLIRAGGEAEVVNASGSSYTEKANFGRLVAFGLLEQKVGTTMTLSGGLRTRWERDRIAVSLGGNITVSITDKWKFMGDVSQSSRLPSLAEGWLLNRENTTLAIAELKYSDSSYSYGVTGFARYVDNPIIAGAVRDSSERIIITRFTNGSSRQALGLSFFGMYGIGKFNVRASGIVQSTILNGQDESRLPLLFTTLTGTYDIFNSTTSRVFFGVQLQARTSFKGEEYYAHTMSYIPSQVQQDAGINGLDLFAGAKLGNAFVKVELQNILSSYYTLVSTFPRIDRNIRLSVAWTFFD